MQYVLPVAVGLCMGLVGSSLAGGMPLTVQNGPHYSGTLNSAPGTIQLALPGFAPPITDVTVDVRLKNGDLMWSTNDYTLVVNREAKTAIGMPFYASYGRYHLSVMQLAPAEYPNIVLITGQGRGTSAFGNLLTIYGVENNSIQPLFTKKLSGYFGEGVQWWYDLEYFEEDIKEEGPTETALSLTLHHDPTDQTPLEDVTVIPKVNDICILWLMGRFQEFDGKSCMDLKL